MNAHRVCFLIAIIFCNAAFAHTIFDFAREGDWNKVIELAIANPDLLFAEEEGTGKTLRDIANERHEADKMANVESIVMQYIKRREEELEREIAEREHSWRRVREPDEDDARL